MPNHDYPQSVCVLGSEGSLYTKMVILELEKRDVPFHLILESVRKSPSRRSLLQRLWGNIEKFVNLSNAGCFKTLPKYDPFFWQKLVDYLRSSRKPQVIEMRKVYHERNPQVYSSPDRVHHVPNVNHVRSYKLLVSSKFDIGLFAGVGIVSEEIINTFSFCLNAHPAPLPACRGGGAIEHTLYYGLMPSVSVHFATREIDGGDVLTVTQIPMKKDDTFFTISARAEVMCAEQLANVTHQFLNGVKFEPIFNNGKLHYWKDCSLQIQKDAEYNLRRLLTQL